MAKQISFSFFEHWIECLLAMAVAAGLLYVLVLWAAPTVAHLFVEYWPWALVILIGLTAPKTVPPLWRAYRAIDGHVEEKKTQRVYRELLQASTEQLKAGYNLEYKNARLGDELKINNPFVALQIAEFKADQRVQVQEEEPLQIEGPQTIPAVVKYEDIVDEVPSGMSLLGIHPSTGELELTSWEKLKCLWMVGSSSTGKSNTVYGKALEAVNHGALLLPVDQHAIKPDSLARKLEPLSHAFIRPVSVSDEEVLASLAWFKQEFEARVAGAPCDQKIVLICDEMNRMMRNEKLIKALKEIVAICGEESRGFGMYGWFLSQKAAHLKWLRDSAITVIVHRLTRIEEAKLACNDDLKAARNLLNFKVGRTYIYGVDFDEPLELQQALYPVVESSLADANAPTIPLQGSKRFEQNFTPSNLVETPLPQRPALRIVEADDEGGYEADVVEDFDVVEEELSELEKNIQEMLLSGASQKQIIQKVWGVSGGDKYVKASAEMQKIIAKLLNRKRA